MAHKAFVSSTFKDLKDHRHHVITSLRSAGFFVDPMEDWSAASDEPKQFSQDRIKDCDLCVLLVGFRRGHVPNGETLSITQLEHQTAVDSGIDVLVFMLKEEAPWPREFDELDKDPAIRRWRGELIEHKGVGFFDLEPSSIEIAPALTRWISENQRPARSTVVAHEMPVTYWAGRPASLRGGFVGREDELRAITRAFAGHRAVVTSGGAGSGKSRLAAEYAHRAGVDGFWTTGEASEALTLADLAPALGIAVKERSDEDISGEVRRRLTGLPPETLWVVDNLTDLELANVLVNVSESVWLLITTRDSRRHLLPATVAYHSIEVLEREAAIALLRSRSNLPAGHPALARIADRVGRLPLALEVLAARLGEPRQSPEKVLAQLEQAPTAVQIDAFRQALGASIPRAEGVFAAIVGTLEDLSAEDRQALAGLAYLADAPVPDALAAALTGLDDEELTALLSMCSQQSVLSWAEGQVTIHALTVAALSATNPDGSLRLVLARANARLVAINEDDPVSLRAELIHHEALHSPTKRGLGADDGSVLDFQNNLAIGYRMAGRVEDAIRLWEQTLEARERVLGPEHPHTLASRNNLAGGYRDAGRIADAIRLVEQTLEAMERLLGPEHPDTLASRSNLAEGYRDAGRVEDAMRLGEQTLEAMEHLLGPEHPGTLTSRNNLAAGYRMAGRIDEAIRLDEQTLEAMERVLGPEHPDTLASRNNLAVGYSTAGRIEDAVRLDEQTLEARERVLGSEHPDTLRSRNNLAQVYRGAGRREDSNKLDEQTLEAMERVLGPEHPDTLMSRNNLAAGYGATGRIEDAIRLLEQTLEAMERVQGPEHPDTLTSRNNLANGYRAAGRIDDAIRLDEQTLEARERVLGPEHPDTLQSRNNLAAGYRDAGRIEDAVGLNEQTLEAMERVLGPEHPHTLGGRNNLANGYRAAGRIEDAVRHWEQTLEAMERVLGPDHPDTLGTRSNLAAGYREAGRIADAAKLESRSED